jgi:Sulfotransferase family
VAGADTVTATLTRAAVWTGAPIVVGGCGRSGTTLLLSILSAHPAIYAIEHETYAFCPNVWNGVGGEPELEVIEAALTDATVRPSHTRWCEKTPKNVSNIPAILGAVPGVRFVHLVRDGRDVVTSVHPGKPGYHVDPDRWVTDVQAGLEYENHGQVATVRYEDLVRDMEGTLTGLFGFLGEPLVQEVLDYPRSATMRCSDAWGHDAVPAYSSSVGRWREDAHVMRVAEFMATDGAPGLLRRLGYA